MRKSFIVAGLLAVTGFVAGCSNSGSHDRQADVRQEPGAIPGSSGMGRQPGGYPTLTGGGQSDQVMPSAVGSATGRVSDPASAADVRPSPGAIPGSSGMSRQPGGTPTVTGGGQPDVVMPSAGSAPTHSGNRSAVTGTQQN